MTFGKDIERTRKTIEDCCGVRVIGYRAPSFSIDQRTPWAFMELAEQGYLYSSSVAPIRHDHYGWADAPRFAFHPLPWHSLIELPVTTAQFRGKRLAAGGGGFFRVLPYAFSRWAIRQVNRDEGRPAIFYFHPWEIDPGQPRVAGRTAAFTAAALHQSGCDGGQAAPADRRFCLGPDRSDRAPRKRADRGGEGGGRSGRLAFAGQRHGGMNAPFALAREAVRVAELRQPDEVARIEGFVAEHGGSVFHRPAWLRAVEAGTGQRARGCWRNGAGRSPAGCR